jgi:hypothetical protein
MGSMTRQQIRDHILGSGAAKPKSELIDLFGMQVEIRQPSLKAMMEAREIEDNNQRIATMIVYYTYVPGTDDRVFEDSDIPEILSWPFGADLTRLNAAITKLTGIDVSVKQEGVDVTAAVAELRKDPLEDQPSSSPSA